MENFPCLYYTYSLRYPESGSRIQLGRSYQFDARSPAPDQRVITLNLSGMAYFGDLVTEPERNIEVLMAFYETHRRDVDFNLQHPTLGNVTCRFNQPLEVPAGVPGGSGVLEDFSVELIEQP